MISATDLALIEGNETVLLVDDDATLRGVIQIVLEIHGYRVLGASSAELALQIWEGETGKIDLVLTDLDLPHGMSGEQLAAKLKSANPAVKLIFASGHNADRSGDNSALHEGVNFLKKPCAMNKLLSTVRACLDQA
jgi:DNA-binding NtrC family response regulator